VCFVEENNERRGICPTPGTEETLLVVGNGKTDDGKRRDVDDSLQCVSIEVTGEQNRDEQYARKYP
jgi:hypothetical protein